MINRITLHEPYLAVVRNHLEEPCLVAMIQVVISRPAAVRAQVRYDRNQQNAQLPQKLPWYELKRDLQQGDVICEYIKNPRGWFILNRRDIYRLDHAAAILDYWTEKNHPKAKS